MKWLWLISVGVTDVQFPVWKQDDYGQWQIFRFRRDRGGIRSVHEGLRNLLDQGHIVFPDELPQDMRVEESGKFKLCFEQEDALFVASIVGDKDEGIEQYRISRSANEIPNDAESCLPLYCPKVSELLDLARETFADAPVSVVVLNTVRLPTFHESRDEPVASGPLVAKLLAEKLGLQWQDNNGRLPENLPPGSSTWLDVLIDDEAAENPAAQKMVVQRLTKVVQVWQPQPQDNIAIATVGGMPILKPFIERVPATCLGQSSIRLLEKTERQAPAQAVSLDYNARIIEQEILRFYCAEALRKGQYAAAYGLASQSPERGWAQAVRNALGPLLELPGGPLRLKGLGLKPVALAGCQIELALCMGDVVSAVKRLGQFIESATWALISEDPRIQNWQLRVDRDEESLVTPWRLPADHELFNQALLDTECNTQRPFYYRVKGMHRSWLAWLAQPDGQHTQCVALLQSIQDDYGEEPRRIRNRLTHGTDDTISSDAILAALQKAKLIAGNYLPFGENFLAANRTSNLLGMLGYPDFAREVNQVFSELIKTVILGDSAA